MGQDKKTAGAGINRRQFLRQTGVALGAAGLAGCATVSVVRPGGFLPPLRVALVIDPADTVAQAAPSQWAVDRLRKSLADGNLCIYARLAEVKDEDLCIVAAGFDSVLARPVLLEKRIAPPACTESLALIPDSTNNRPAVYALGSDPRGLSYALTELADRISRRIDPRSSLDLSAPLVERPATPIRSIMKIFTSDVEDKGWFNDRDGWRQYLSMLAAERFNRFNLAFGVGYDFARNVRDAYFYFAYPFLLAVPGYDVRATNLPDAQRDSNLQMLRFISDEAAARGLHFQLGIWTHAYIWTDSPGVNHTIEGLTPQTHAPYCREALKLLLQQCPNISGITFRIHGESGVPEGNYDFWKTVFDGIVQCGRKVEIDMHAKGMDQEMIDVALATGMPVNVDPKSWAEHMGLPYHQAGIRSVEMPPPNRQDQGFFSRSSGSRSFLRYGYGDLLREDRKYGVLHRTWPGTQRLLLWGDPESAAAWAKFATFCGSVGLELFEPLSFKGRKGSGLPGGRDAYTDTSLKPRADWEKYTYGYRLWGRLLYNPQTDPQVWSRLLIHEYDGNADSLQNALASASRILPLITTAHCPSAANNNYWPELYTNMSIVDASHPGPYGDTPAPKRFGAVSPLDPQLFYRIDDFADDLLKGQLNGKYSPIEVSQWLMQQVDDARAALYSIEHGQGAEITNDSPAPLRRLIADVRIQAGIGAFFACKFRAAVLWSIHLQTGDTPAGQQAIDHYQKAGDAWAVFASAAVSVYVSDITFGLEKQLRGHWQDRLPAIGADVHLMRRTLEAAPIKDGGASVKAAVDQVVHLATSRPQLDVEHQPPAAFRPGQAIALKFQAGGAEAASLYYRHVDQAEAFTILPLPAESGNFSATIPAEYTRSPFPIQYYLQLHSSKSQPTLYPGLGRSLTQQPYFVLRQARA